MLFEVWSKVLFYLYFPEEMLTYLDVCVRLLFSMYYLPIWAIVFAVLHSCLESIVYTLIVPAALQVQRGVQQNGWSYLEAAAAAAVAGGAVGLASTDGTPQTASSYPPHPSTPPVPPNTDPRLLFDSQVLDSLVPHFLAAFLTGLAVPLPLQVAFESLAVIFAVVPYGALALAACTVGHKVMTIIIEAMVDAFSRLEDGKDYPLVAARLRFVCKNPRRFSLFSVVCASMYLLSFVALSTTAILEYADRPIDVVIVSMAIITVAVIFMLGTAIHHAPRGLKMLANNRHYISPRSSDKKKRRSSKTTTKVDTSDKNTDADKVAKAFSDAIESVGSSSPQHTSSSDITASPSEPSQMYSPPLQLFSPDKLSAAGSPYNYFPEEVSLDEDTDGYYREGRKSYDLHPKADGTDVSSLSKKSRVKLASQELWLRKLDARIPGPSPELVSYVTGTWWETSIHRVRHMAVELLLLYFLLNTAFGNGFIATAPKAVEIMIYLNLPHLLGFFALAVTESIIRRAHSVLWLLRHPSRFASIVLVSAPHVLLLVYCATFFYPAPIPTALLIFAAFHQAVRAIDLARCFEVSPQGGVVWIEIRPPAPAPQVMAAAMSILASKQRRQLFVPNWQNEEARTPLSTLNRANNSMDRSNNTGSFDSSFSRAGSTISFGEGSPIATTPQLPSAPQPSNVPTELPVNEGYAIMLEDARQRGKCDMGIVGLDTAADIGLMRLYRRGQTLPSRLERRVVPQPVSWWRRSFYLFASPQLVLLLGTGSFSGTRFSNVRRVQKYLTWSLLGVFFFLIAGLVVQSVVPSLQPAPMGSAVDEVNYKRSSLDHLIVRLTFLGKGRDNQFEKDPSGPAANAVTGKNESVKITAANKRALVAMNLSNEDLITQSPFAPTDHEAGSFPDDSEDEYPGLCRATFSNDVSVFELALLSLFPYLSTASDVERVLGFFNENMDTNWTLATSLWANGTFANRPADCWASDPHPPPEMIALCAEANRSRVRDWSGFMEFYDPIRSVRVISVRGTDPTAAIDLMQDINMFFEAALYQVLASIVPGAGILPTSLVADFIRVSSLTDVFSQGGYWDPLNRLKTVASSSGEDFHKVSDSVLKKLFSRRNKQKDSADGTNIDEVVDEEENCLNQKPKEEQLEELRKLVAKKASSLPRVISSTELGRVVSDRDYYLRVMRYTQSRMERMVKESVDDEEAKHPEPNQKSKDPKDINGAPAATDQKIYPVKVREQVIMTGHSLGGGIAHIVGIRLKLRSVAFGAPGIVLSHKKFGISDLKSVHSRTFTVASSNDIVPLIGWQGGEVHHVECVAKTSELCHVMEFMIGAIWHNCRTVRDRYPKLIDVL